MSGLICARSKWRITAGALVAACVTLIAGPSSADAKAKAAAPSLTKVTIANISTADMTVLVLGRQANFFRKQGIDLKINTTLAIPQAPAAVISGAVDMTAFSWGAALAFKANGLPVKTIATLTTGGTTVENDANPIVALTSSGIRSLSDLGGKTVGVPSLRGNSELQVRIGLIRAGVDPKTVKIVQLQFATMGTALRSKAVDAAYMAEPWVTLLKTQAPIRKIAGGNVTIAKDLPVVNVFTSDKYYNANKSLIRGFRIATRQSMAYAKRYPAKMRKAIVDWLKLPADIVNKARLPNYTLGADMVKLQKLSDFFYKFGFTKAKIDVADAYGTGQ